jgi:hypothetical protein
MRKIRLFTTAVAVSLTAALSPAAVGVAHAAVGSYRVDPDVSMWSRPWGTHIRYYASCPSTKDVRAPGALYAVKGNHIHIRVSPGGAVESGIRKGTPFASDWVVEKIGGHQCVAKADGQSWVLGVSRSGQVGWVGAKYLKLVRRLVL